MRRVAALVAMTLALALPAGAAPSKAELLQQAAAGAAACANAMPDSKATGDALKAANFKLDEADGTLKAYTALGKRVLVAITSNSARMDACFVLSSGMTPAEAESLIQPWLAASAAKPIPGGGKFSKAWRGTLKGGPVELLIADHIDFNIVRGAAIIARTPVK